MLHMRYAWQGGTELFDEIDSPTNTGSSQIERGTDQSADIQATTSSTAL